VLCLLSRAGKKAEKVFHIRMEARVNASPINSTLRNGDYGKQNRTVFTYRSVRRLVATLFQLALYLMVHISAPCASKRDGYYAGL